MDEGAQFGPYRVLGPLGRGGMGEVLRAHDAEHERDVALKVLHPQWASDESYRERFRREARVAARLREPHVVPIHRYGEIDGRLFLDMRLVEGEDLASLLRRTGPLDPARAVDIVGQVARALDAAHADGLVHRDVKPSNVLMVGRADGGDLVRSGAGEDFVYLVDFGIARTLDSGAGPPLTGAGLAIGSTEYMAPERFLSGVAGPGADVYSLACVLFEALTGRRPFEARDAANQMYAHVNSAPPPPSSINPHVPIVLDAVVLRGLAKQPDGRWTSAGGMAAAARAALGISGVEVPRPDEVPLAAGTAPTTIGLAGVDASRSETRERPRAADTAVQAPPYVPPASGPRAAGADPALVVGEGARSTRGTVGDDPHRGGVRRSLFRALIAAVVVLALVAGGLAVWLWRTQERVAEAEAATTEARQGLLAVGLPTDVDLEDCTGVAGTGGVLAALDCGASPTDGGPATQRFELYASAQDAAQAFDDVVDHDDLVRLDGKDDSACSGSEGRQGWVRLTSSDGQELGRLSCSVDDVGDPVLTWTWDDRPGYATVTARGGAESGLPDLLRWWRDTVDRGNSPQPPPFGGVGVP